MSNLSVILSAMGVGTQMSYSPTTNSFLSSGYTSAAGNTYFYSVRLSEHLVIKEDVGQGHTHTFLNGISIYTRQGVLLAQGRYNCCRYDLDTVKHKATNILLEEMERVALRQSISFNRQQLQQEVGKQIAESISRLPGSSIQGLLGA